MAGRPTKYDPDMCQKVIDLMREGRSLATVCAELGIHVDTMAEWRKDPEKTAFSEAIKTGIALSQGWWEELGRRGAAEQAPVNPPVWIFNMKNRFNWRDKTDNEHTGKDGAPLFKSYMGVDVDKV